jgi:hypothetical protein
VGYIGSVTVLKDEEEEGRKKETKIYTVRTKEEGRMKNENYGKCQPW